MNILNLTYRAGSRVYVFADHIVSFHPCLQKGKQWSQLYLSDGRQFEVIETCDELREMINPSLFTRTTS